MKSTLAAALLLTALIGCQPTVQVKAPEEPITINLNVKIEHEIRVKVDRDLEEVMKDESDIF
jgi:hypothetical protein